VISIERTRDNSFFIREKQSKQNVGGGGGGIQGVAREGGGSKNESHRGLVWPASAKVTRKGDKKG